MLKRMKRLLILSALFFLTNNFLFAQNKDSLISDIRGKYIVIRENNAPFDINVIKILGESTEGGQATTFYDKSDLKMVEVVWFGETGKRIIEYYFDKGRIFFAFDQEFNYNRPFYYNNKMADWTL